MDPLKHKKVICPNFKGNGCDKGEVLGGSFWCWL